MRTRLRRLLLDGRTFVWHADIRHVQGSGDCHRCIRVRIWGNGKTSRALQADLLSAAWPSPWSACATDGSYPTSGDIRAIITYALDNGWPVDERGPAFRLSEQSHATRFELDGFLLTDRLRTPPGGGDPTLRVIRSYEARQQA